ARGEPFAERVGPRHQLHAEAHNEQDDRRVAPPGLGVLDVDAVRPDCRHLPPPSGGAPKPPRTPASRRQPPPFIAPPTARTSARGISGAPLATTLLARPGTQIVSP